MKRPALAALAVGVLIVVAVAVLAVDDTNRDALLAPSATRRLLDRFVSALHARDTRRSDIVGALTEREVDVLKLMARGLSNAEIAQKLFVGETTVKTHVSRVLMKLDLRDRVQAVVLAYEEGLVQSGFQ